jgi:hypothetical protein
MRNRTFFTFTIVASAELFGACASAPPRVDGVASVYPRTGDFLDTARVGCHTATRKRNTNSCRHCVTRAEFDARRRD